jgi:hypothetical protein
VSGRRAEAATSAFRARHAATAATQATGPGAAAAGTTAAISGANALTAGGERGGWKPPRGFEHGGGPNSRTAGGRGLRNPSWQEIKDHVPVELAAAKAREHATTRADVAQAMRALSPDARDAVMDLMDAKGGQIRGQMAHQAARGDLTDPEREAFRSLAAASPESRARGIGDLMCFDTETQRWSAGNAAGSAGPERDGTPPTAPESSATPPSAWPAAAGRDPRTAGGPSSSPAAPVRDGGPMGSPAATAPPSGVPDPPSPGDAAAAPPPRAPNPDAS